MVKKLVPLLLLLLLLAAGYWAKNRFLPPAPTPKPTDKLDFYPGISYTSVEPGAYDIALINSELASPTRVKFTPDSKFLLLTQLTGEVFAFHRTPQGDFESAPNLVTKVDTNFPGFPPDEAGLVGLAFSSRYSQNGSIFLFYTYKDKDGKVYNRIASTTVSETNGRLWAKANPRLIFQANVPGTGSHQITDGLGQDNRLIFLIGEGFEAKRAQDPSLHAGKLMSIAEDGSDPRVHALGIRNAYVLERLVYADSLSLLIADTGPDHWDRLILTPLPTSLTPPLNFNWDGTEDSLTKPVLDLQNPKVDQIILRLPDTRTFTGLAFEVSTVYATLFGQTGSKSNSPGKEIWAGTWTNRSGQTTLNFTPIIGRRPEADGFFGNPIGLARDPRSGHLFFLDILEGRLYEVKPQGR